MKFNQYLQEEYLFRTGGLEVFINPSPKELRSCGPDVRYIADFKTGNIYVWGAMGEIHVYIANKLYDAGLFPYKDIYSAVETHITMGIGKVEGGKIRFVESDVLDTQVDTLSTIKNKWINKDDSWLDQWFTKPYNATLVKYIKKRFKQYLQEEFRLMDVGYGNDEYTVFENPSKKEMAEASGKKNAVRFIIDLKTKKLYIWFAYAQIHHPVAQKLGIKEDSLYSEPRYIFGNAEYVKGKLDNLSNVYKIRKTRYKYDWLTDYFSSAAVEGIKKRTIPVFSEAD